MLGIWRQGSDSQASGGVVRKKVQVQEQLGLKGHLTR